MKPPLYTVLDLDVEGDVARLRQVLLPAHTEREDEEATHEAIVLFDHIIGIGARAAVLEYGYVDQDYRSEFANFYAGCFSDVSSLCDRLHLFSNKVAGIGDIIGTDFRESYLGYVVLRPLLHARIGRTVVPPQVREGEAISCLAQEPAHLLGTDFAVSAAPFMQQTSQVTKCAQVSLWAASRYMSLRYGFPLFTPEAINAAATRTLSPRRRVPSDGLEPEYMAAALIDMGFGPLRYRPSTVNPEKGHAALLETMVRSLASGIPPIVILMRKRTVPFHAVTVVGSRWKHRLPSVTGVKLPNIAYAAADFVAMDNEKGPYVALGDRLTHTSLNQLILPFPKKVYLKLEDAESEARQLLLSDTWAEYGVYEDELGAAFLAKISNRRIVMNTYAIQSTEYKSHIAQQPALPFGGVYLTLRLPHWVVVCELLELDERGHPLGVVGEVILDSTASLEPFSALAVHTPGWLVLFESVPEPDAAEHPTGRAWAKITEARIPQPETPPYKTASALGAVL